MKDKFIQRPFDKKNPKAAKKRAMAACLDLYDQLCKSIDGGHSVMYSDAKPSTPRHQAKRIIFVLGIDK